MFDTSNPTEDLNVWGQRPTEIFGHDAGTDAGGNAPTDVWSNPVVDHDTGGGIVETVLGWLLG